MKIYKRIIALLILFIIMVSGYVSAGPLMSIGSMYEVLPSEQRSLTKRIYNNGDASAFVRVEVMRIDPSQKGTEVPVRSLKDDALVTDRLLVTPMRMIVPPNNFQNSRILWSGKRDTEQYYRVRYTPVLPGKNDGFGIDDKTLADYRARAIHAGVNILTGYGTVVIVHPDVTNFDSRIKQSGKSLEVINAGNATIVMEDIKICKSKNDQCAATSRAFVLPGRTYILDNNNGKSVRFILLEGKNKKVMEF